MRPQISENGMLFGFRTIRLRASVAARTLHVVERNWGQNHSDRADPVASQVRARLPSGWSPLISLTIQPSFSCKVCCSRCLRDLAWPISPMLLLVRSPNQACGMLAGVDIPHNCTRSHVARKRKDAPPPVPADGPNATIEGANANFRNWRVVNR
jgi:hypothetical protein